MKIIRRLSTPIIKTASFVNSISAKVLALVLVGLAGRKIKRDLKKIIRKRST